jgi:hypothetical protein
VTAEERTIALYEKEKIKALLATEGAQIIAQKLNKLVAESTREQLTANPFKNPERIVRAQQLRYLVESEFPLLLQEIVNFGEEEKWSIFSWIKQVLGR